MTRASEKGDAPCPVCTEGIEGIVVCQGCYRPRHKACDDFLKGSLSPGSKTSIIPCGTPGCAGGSETLQILDTSTPSDLEGNVADLSTERSLEKTSAGKGLPASGVTIDADAAVQYQETLRRVSQYQIRPVPGWWKRLIEKYEIWSLEELAYRGVPVGKVKEKDERDFHVAINSKLEEGGFSKLNTLLKSRIVAIAFKEKGNYLLLPTRIINYYSNLTIQFLSDYASVVQDLLSVKRYEDAIAIAEESKNDQLLKRATYAVSRVHLAQEDPWKAWEALFRGKNYDRALEILPEIIKGHGVDEVEKVYRTHLKCIPGNHHVEKARLARRFEEVYIQIKGEIPNVTRKSSASISYDVDKQYHYTKAVWDFQSKNDILGLLELAKEFGDQKIIHQYAEQVQDFSGLISSFNGKKEGT